MFLNVPLEQEGKLITIKRDIIINLTVPPSATQWRINGWIMGKNLSSIDFSIEHPFMMTTIDVTDTYPDEESFNCNCSVQLFISNHWAAGKASIIPTTTKFSQNETGGKSFYITASV